MKNADIFTLFTSIKWDNMSENIWGFQVYRDITFVPILSKISV